MASQWPPVKGQAFSFEIGLYSQADTKLFQDNPTMANGDFVVIQDGVLDGNMDNLPAAVVGCTRLVTFTWSADEMTADRLATLCHDVAGGQWCDFTIFINTVAQTLDLVDGNVDAIKAKTDNLPASPAAVGSAMTLTGAYDAAKTAAQPGADGDTLKTLSDQLDTAQTDLDNPDQYKADVSTLATAAALATAQADLDNPDQYKADVSALATAAALATAQADLDSPDQYKADVSGLATAAALATAQADLDNPDQYKADVAALALEANVEGHAADALTAWDPPTQATMHSEHALLATVAGLAAHDAKLDIVDANVDAVLVDTGTDIPAAIAALPTAVENADALLTRDWTAVVGEAARSVLNALRFLRNKWSIAGTTLTVTEEDDSTAAWTGTVTTDASAEPVTGTDPT